MGTVLRRRAAVLGRAVPGIRRLHQWDQHRLRPRLYSLVRDTENRIRYGAGAPRLAERLWIDPLAVNEFMVAGSSLWDSASVTSTRFDRASRQPVGDDEIMRAAEARWDRGCSWEETGEIERMERAIAARGPLKGLRTRADILARCRRLDEIFEVVRRERRIRPQSELEGRGWFREVGGIGMHIGPDGVPIRAANGRHRFAMARILELPRIPVRVGLVHPSALGLIDDLRRDDAGAGRPPERVRLPRPRE